jgi:hypothetical protein
MSAVLPDRCPHSSQRGAKPSTCSLCVASATGMTPKHVSFDADTGKLTMDGVAVQRGTNPDPAKVTPPNARRPRRGGRRARECSLCGSTDHAKPRCDGSGRRELTNAEGDRL